MILEKIYLANFRNHTYFELSFDPLVTAIVGTNGTGKSSLIEAIRYLSTGRSYRGCYDKEIVNWNQDQFTLRAEFSGSELESIGIKYNQQAVTSSKKTVYLDNRPLQRLSELQGIFPTVLHHPEQFEILLGGPAQRRELIDFLLCQTETDYLDNLKIYQRALNQRNSLLKKASGDSLLFDQYETQLAGSAEKIQTIRSQMLQELEPLLQDEVERLGKDLLEPLQLSYKSGLSEDRPVADQFKAERRRGLQRGYTTIGIQRDDWQLLNHRGQRFKDFASRGELKVILLALKLAEIRYMGEIIGKNPLFLADDFMAELDRSRQLYTLDRVKQLGIQFVFSAVNYRPLEPVARVIPIGDQTDD